jgi:hypothetical protein
MGVKHGRWYWGRNVGWSAHRCGLYLLQHTTLESDIHAPGGIRTLSQQASGYWDRPLYIFQQFQFQLLLCVLRYLRLPPPPPPPPPPDRSWSWVRMHLRSEVVLLTRWLRVPVYRIQLTLSPYFHLRMEQIQLRNVVFRISYDEHSTESKYIKMVSCLPYVNGSIENVE